MRDLPFATSTTPSWLGSCKECVRQTLRVLRNFTVTFSRHSHAPTLPLFLILASPAPHRAALSLQQYRCSHDSLHVLLGLPPSVLGELGVKWFEMVQTGLPMCALSSFFGVLSPSLTRAERSDFFSRLVPWASTAGKEAQPLLSVAIRFESAEVLATPLDELRRKLRVTEAPPAAGDEGHGHSRQSGGEQEQ